MILHLSGLCVHYPQAEQFQKMCRGAYCSILVSIFTEHSKGIEVTNPVYYYIKVYYSLYFCTERLTGALSRCRSNRASLFLRGSSGREF